MPKAPAYLKALKEYARIQIGDAKMTADATDSLSTESDRGALILAATSIEDTLEWTLGMRMKPLETDISARKEIFGVDGILGTYSEKISMAYALGIIDKRGRNDIDLVREIRNACAHARLPITMEIPQVSIAVKAALGPDMLKDMKDNQPKTLRAGFICHCAALAAYVATGKRRSPLEVFGDIVRTRNGRKS
jgi:hypothetical protein